VCPFCKSEDTRVIDSRFARDQQAIRRRRCCNICNRRFTTYERVERVLPIVVKRDGRREAFNIDKIRAGIQHACHKRPVPAGTLDTLLAQIERHFADAAEREIDSQVIGDRVLRFLARHRSGRLRALRLGLPRLQRRAAVCDRAGSARRRRRPARAGG
jgi:transcriptional repressor NrdR